MVGSLLEESQLMKKPRAATLSFALLFVLLAALGLGAAAFAADAPIEEYPCLPEGA